MDRLTDPWISAYATILKFCGQTVCSFHWILEGTNDSKTLETSALQFYINFFSHPLHNQRV